MCVCVCACVDPLANKTKQAVASIQRRTATKTSNTHSLTTGAAVSGPIARAWSIAGLLGAIAARKIEATACARAVCGRKARIRHARRLRASVIACAGDRVVVAAITSQRTERRRVMHAARGARVGWGTVVDGEVVDTAGTHAAGRIDVVWACELTAT